MRVSQFDFTLPESLIATHPAEPRDSARMLVVGEELQDKSVRDLLAFLRAGDVMVFNDTKVIPARLFGKRGAAKIEVLLHKRLSVIPTKVGIQWEVNNDWIPAQGGNDECWSCFTKPAKKLRVGDAIIFAEDFAAKVIEKFDDGQVALQFSGDDVFEKLQRYGHMPLPPYINRADNEADKSRYQTVYAQHDGSVAAPTAGLHFTPELLAVIDGAGVKRVHVTLHVGAGTFQPVKVEDTNDHVMHSEWAEVSQEAADAINSASRVIAVGTTSLRTLESAADEQGVVHPMARETDIFITPGYRFRTVDMLMTNFHLPKSTLFMLVSAFSGLERMQSAYAHAIKNHYRFYSYGDACLLSLAR